MHKSRQFKRQLVRTTTHDYCGFTLIELLVVISIISLLMAILLPALEGARTAAQQAGSLSNSRQITTALHAYAAEHSQHMPFMRQQTFQNSSSSYIDYRWGPNWAQTLYDMGYLTSTSVFWSAGRDQAMDHGVEDVRSEWPTRPNPYTFECVGYGLNTGVGGSTEYNFFNNGGYAPLRLDEANAPPPVKMILVAEGFHSGFATGGTVGSQNGYYAVAPGRYSNSSSFGLFSYRGSVVRSYVDGHASSSGQSAPTAVSGHSTHVGTYAQVSANEIGWSTDAVPPSSILPGSYAGYWTYRSFVDGQSHMPWYTDWRDLWYPGLR